MRWIRARAQRSTAEHAAAAASGSSSDDGSQEKRPEVPAISNPHTHSHHQSVEEDHTSPQAHMDVLSQSLLARPRVSHRRALTLSLPRSPLAVLEVRFCLPDLC